jgi:uncharacterized protein YciI
MATTTLEKYLTWNNTSDFYNFRLLHFLNFDKTKTDSNILNKTMKHFFYKLIPPRPDFHLTQNENEKAIMQQHAAYWAQLTADKKAIIYGPVFHEEGVFGIAIIEVATDDEANEIAQNDPAISSNVNTYELSPMVVGLIRT